MTASSAVRIPRPMLCSSGDLPSGTGWAFEIKWDGARALAAVDASGLQLRSRGGETVAARYPELAGLAQQLAGRDCVLDGELVSLDGDGRPSLRLLQRRLSRTRPAAGLAPVSYYVFDLLALDGRSLLRVPYEQRRGLLAELAVSGSSWTTTPYYIDDGPSVLAAAERFALEGVVAKRLTSSYQPGKRSRDWVKVKLRGRQEFVVGAVEGGKGSRAGKLGCLHLGVFDGDALRYVGAVGSGFDTEDLRQLHELLVPLASDRNPFAAWRCPPGIICLAPQLVVEVEFLRFTDDGMLREPVYKGVRSDIDAASVRRES